jgi:hypothetical protein
VVEIPEVPATGVRVSYAQSVGVGWFEAVIDESSNSSVRMEVLDERRPY